MNERRLKVSRSLTVFCCVALSLPDGSLYTLHKLSRPPQATSVPLGE